MTHAAPPFGLHSPTLGAGMARTFLDFASARGLSRSTLLGSAGLHEDDIATHEARISADAFLSLVTAAETATNDPLFILDFGSAVHATETSIVCVIGSTCETMAEAHAHLNRYARLTLDVGTRHHGPHFPLEMSRDGLWFIDDRDLPSASRQITEASLVRIACGTRLVQATPPLLRGVHFRHAPAGPVARYEAVFGAPVRFRQTRNALLFDPAWPDLRVRQAPAHVSSVLLERAAALLASLDEARTLSGRVHAQLRARLGKESVSMDAVARALAMSRQTLYRGLREEGVTFEDLLDHLRRRAAEDLLRSDRLAVQAAAQRCGFRDVAAFSRAFKRWTGVSPTRYRAAS